MQQEESSTDYDGIYFLPGDEEGELVLSYFDFNNEMAGGVPARLKRYEQNRQVLLKGMRELGFATLEDFV